MVDRRGGKKENGLPDPNAQHLRFYKFVIDSLPTAIITVNGRTFTSDLKTGVVTGG